MRLAGRRSYSIFRLEGRRSYSILRLAAGLGTAFFSVQYVPLFSVLLKERSFLFRSFFEFLATYKTQKNVPNAKNATFFSKERK